MSQLVTLDLPDEVVRRAHCLASLSNRDVAQILAEAVSVALPPLDAVFGEQAGAVSEMPDAEVLRLADLQFTAAQDRSLSRLLDKQQGGVLADEERRELLALMQVYQGGLLRKAEALAEAVRRGLREPLSP